MRALVQRVSWAHVEVEGHVIGEIKKGLLVYLGIGKKDGQREREWMLGKITTLRIFPNDAGKMDKSVLDVGGSLLVISQFTLYGDTSRGRRPSFENAMTPVDASAAYDLFLDDARKIVNTQCGKFGADMLVSSANDGPVTLWIDSDE